MEDLTSKTIAVFTRPFNIPGFDETLPPGSYEIETELASPPDYLHPEAWKASVLVRLHAREAQPGLTRSLTVSLADLDHARAQDKLTGRAISDFFLEEMLADPMVRLVMKADGVSDVHLRHLYSGLRTPQTDREVLESRQESQLVPEEPDILNAENEGMPPRPAGPQSCTARLFAGQD
jgi:hypothetical protein